MNTNRTAAAFSGSPTKAFSLLPSVTVTFPACQGRAPGDRSDTTPSSLGRRTNHLGEKNRGKKMKPRRKNNHCHKDTTNFVFKMPAASHFLIDVVIKVTAPLSRSIMSPTVQLFTGFCFSGLLRKCQSVCRVSRCQALSALRGPSQAPDHLVPSRWCCLGEPEDVWSIYRVAAGDKPLYNSLPLPQLQLPQRP